MAFSIDSKIVYQESYMLIDTEFLEEMDDSEQNEDSEFDELNDIDIENYMQELRNVGSNFTSQYNSNELDAMSQEELKQMYEAEILREKYGDDYENMMNETYEDYLTENNSPDNNSENTNSQDENASESYTGPALVFVKLDNPNRGNSYIDVPVFTCKDGGTVVINISLNSEGKVKSASVASVKSTGDAACISNSAKKAALNSRFTVIAGGKTEYGQITYQFIQQ